MGRAARKADLSADRTSAAAKAKSTIASAEGQAEPAPRRKTLKQAVVIVHGMGEQKPLETLRGFVQAVWGGKSVPSDKPTPEDVWLVPDSRAGLKELARIATRRNEDDLRTDFYELYWSDLMVGNTLSQIRGWLTGLLWRWPHQVPKETFYIWLVLWAMTLIGIGLVAYVGLNPLQTIKEVMAPADTGAAANAGQAGQEYVPAPLWVSATLSFALGILVAWLLVRRLEWMLDLGKNRAEAFYGIWAMETPETASASRLYSAVAILVVAVLVGSAAYCFFPWAILSYPRVWAALVVLGFGFILSIIVPVFGDVARYVRTSPDAVAARSDIRERGLKLMRDLHGLSPAPSDKVRSGYDPGEESDYVRIVLVGHSLGSIVAYDVLRLLWEEIGPSSQNPPSDAARERLEDLNDYLVSCSPHERPTNAYKRDWDVSIPTLRGKQAAVADELNKLKHGWRISDFVTLGSPLSHAEFLISRDRSAFEERKAERMFPTCPPAMEPREAIDKYSFIYADSEGRRFPHHAAPFAATRWTNIYDPSSMLVDGDFISGPCQPNFGPGVLDVALTIYKDSLLSRMVTHTSYWDDRAEGTATEEELGKVGLAPDGARQDHLRILRAALKLGNPKRLRPSTDEE